MPQVQALPQLRERFLLVLVPPEAQGTIQKGTPPIPKLILVQTSMEPRARALTNAIPPRRRIPEISYSRATAKTREGEGIQPIRASSHLTEKKRFGVDPSAETAS
jgi:hypothetical protein